MDRIDAMKVFVAAVDEGSLASAGRRLGRSPAAVIVSALIVGGLTPGIVPLVLGRIHELVPHNSAGQRAAWAQATTTFALFQAAAAYGLSYLFERSGHDYAILFVIGAGAVAAALAVDLVTALTFGRKRPRRKTAA